MDKRANRVSHPHATLPFVPEVKLAELTPSLQRIQREENHARSCHHWRNGGLGESISTKMHAAGYRVVVTYSPGNKRVKDWLAEQKASGREFTAYPVDVTDFDSCKTCICQIVEDAGPVDILVNNAGITRDTTFKKMTKNDWDAVIRTNLDSAFNMTKQVLDGMVDRTWGRIINVSSVNGSKGAFGQTNWLSMPRLQRALRAKPASRWLYTDPKLRQS
jgi:NAD(P)-dependent dehydrogenase (short-subunit alcohol dehydrogenase family)